jgi:hypothetical protein
MKIFYFQVRHSRHSGRNNKNSMISVRGGGIALLLRQHLTVHTVRIEKPPYPRRKSSSCAINDGSNPSISARIGTKSSFLPAKIIFFGFLGGCLGYFSRSPPPSPRLLRPPVTRIASKWQPCDRWRQKWSARFTSVRSLVRVQ